MGVGQLLSFQNDVSLHCFWNSMSRILQLGCVYFNNMLTMMVPNIVYLVGFCYQWMALVDTMVGGLVDACNNKTHNE